LASQLACDVAVVTVKRAVHIGVARRPTRIEAAKCFADLKGHRLTQVVGVVSGEAKVAYEASNAEINTLPHILIQVSGVDGVGSLGQCFRATSRDSCFRRSGMCGPRWAALPTAEIADMAENLMNAAC
jgi:hypothetical protein